MSNGHALARASPFRCLHVRVCEDTKKLLELVAVQLPNCSFHLKIIAFLAMYYYLDTCAGNRHICSTLDCRIPKSTNRRKKTCDSSGFTCNHIGIENVPNLLMKRLDTPMKNK